MKASLFGVIVCSLLASACGKKQEVTPATQASLPTTGADATVATPSAPDAAAAAPDAAPAPDAKPAPDAAAKEPTPAHVPLTPERFEELVMAIGECKIAGTMIEPRCPAAVALQKELAHRDSKLPGEFVTALGVKLLTSDKVALRVKASELLELGYGGGKEGKDALLTAYAAEKDKDVRLAFMRAMGAYASLDPKTAEVLVAALGDKELEVRAHAIYALTEPLNKKLKGVTEQLIKVIKNDPEPKLRRVACEHAGKLGDEKLLPLMAELTAETADRELAESCMRGLVAMWLDYPRFENASRDAYYLTLRLLERTPRNAEMPSWAAIGKLARLDMIQEPESKLTPAQARAVSAWKARSKGWYDATDVRLKLIRIVTDPDASEQAAAKAIDALAALKAPRSDIENLQKQLGTTPRMAEKGLVAEAFKRVLYPELVNKGGVTVKQKSPNNKIIIQQPTKGPKIKGPADGPTPAPQPKAP